MIWFSLVCHLTSSSEELGVQGWDLFIMCLVISFLKCVVSHHLSSVLSYLVIYQMSCLITFRMSSLLSFIKYLVLSYPLSNIFSPCWSLRWVCHWWVSLCMPWINTWACVCVCVNAGLRIQSDSWVNILCKVGEKDITFLLVSLSWWTYNVAFSPVTSRISRA